MNEGILDERQGGGVELRLRTRLGEAIHARCERTAYAWKLRARCRTHMVTFTPTAVATMLMANNVTKVKTTVSLTAFPTPAGPPSTVMPLWQAMSPADRPNTEAFTQAMTTSAA